MMANPSGTREHGDDTSWEMGPEEISSIGSPPVLAVAANFLFFDVLSVQTQRLPNGQVFVAGKDAGTW